MEPLVSVIIPTYGYPTFLYKTINSVLNQNYDDWELIVVDDNSSESENRKLTQDILNSFQDNRIRYIKHPRNLNGAVARNTGIRESKGKYISFLDSDDEYLPDRLEKCVKIIESQDQEFAGVYTGCEFRQKGKTYNRYTNVKDGNYLVDTLACTFMFCSGSNIFVRREVVEEIHGFDESFSRHQDYEFLVRIFSRYSLKAIPEILVIKNNENVNLPDVNKMLDIKQQYLGKFSYIINTLSEADQNYIYHSNYISLAEQHQRQGNIMAANKLYNKASEYGRLTPPEWKRRILLPFLKFVRR